MIQEIEKAAARQPSPPAGFSFLASDQVCKAMEGLVEEGKEVIKEKGDRLVLDAALIAAAQRVEHYEISRTEARGRLQSI